MKKIDKLIATSFIGPSILSFFIATFVLVMQFLWKYIDEILGKGFTMLEVLELVFYFAVQQIPLSVPITILISSVMVYGDMAEKYELSSMKSAGVSLLRIMLPSIFIALAIGLFSLLASNFLKPAANLQFQKRFTSIRKQKSTLAIEEGIFNNAFNETIIRVGKIDKNGRDIKDVLIYDHTQNDKSLIGVTSSKGGEMYSADEGRYFVMKLDTGVQYSELEKRTKLGSSKTEQPFMRTYFDQWTKSFDMSQFDADDGVMNFNRNREDMMNTFQLLRAIDTFQTHINENTEKVDTRIRDLFKKEALVTVETKKDSSQNTTTQLKPVAPKKDSTHFIKKIVGPKKLYQDPSNKKSSIPAIANKDSIEKAKKSLIDRYKTAPKDVRPIIINQLKKLDTMKLRTPIFPVKIVTQKKNLQLDSIHHFAQTIDSSFYREVIGEAISNLSRDRDEMMALKNITQDDRRASENYKLKLNQQYSWAAICIVFLFIGGPLGSIIRKGGYGYPLLVSILFYMVFIINTIVGQKLVKAESMGGIQAAWLPCIILVPFAVLLTFMALRDIKFNPTALFEFLYRLRRKKE